MSEHEGKTLEEYGITEKDFYGKWVDSDEGVTITVATVNPVLDRFEADGFTAEAVMLKDESTTVLRLRHIETKALFEVTWAYQEEENKNG